MTTNPPAMIASNTSQTTAPQVSATPLKPDASKTSLPKLPIPPLKDTCARYLRSLEGLQDEEEHEKTKSVVKEFLESGEGDKWQKRLVEYGEGVDSYIEEFWCESANELADERRELPESYRICGTELGELVIYLADSRTLSSSSRMSWINPSDPRSDVTPRLHPQLSRAASLILASLSFIHDHRNGLLQPDSVRGVPLDMSQYSRLFGACRVPTDVSPSSTRLTTARV
jgi:carnitine O-acetyltransferase